MFGTTPSSTATFLTPCSPLRGTGSVRRSSSSSWKKVALVLGLSSSVVLLQGCGGGKDKTEGKVVAGEGSPIKSPDTIESCTEKCTWDALYSRWSNNKFGHLCMDDTTGQARCECSTSTTTPAGCTPPSGSSLLASSSSSAAAAAPAPLRQHGKSKSLLARSNANSETTALLASDGSVDVVNSEDHADSEIPLYEGSLLENLAGSASAVKYTQADTVKNFCEGEGLRKMHGKTASEDLDGEAVTRDLESKIMGDIAHELESNNVDKMAKEIFSFYICARWVPDEIFWELAKQELASQMTEQVFQGTDLNVAIADMYRTYRFVPMLCSKNLEVFREKDEVDHTYFRKFKTEAAGLGKWLRESSGRPILRELANVDGTFCEEGSMNSCGASEWQKKLENVFHISWFDKDDEKTEQLAKKFTAFTENQESGFQEDFADWKTRFPFHSFIGKPGDFKATTKNSPGAQDRFVVCFGKRVASELHRRPGGAHILTDQNNIGCHGWYHAEKTADQLQRMIELWKPPTCQLAEMTYVMKKEIMQKFQQMNERLFDSLPSIINDEMQAGEDGVFDWEGALDKPYAPAELETDDGRVLVDGMRVGALRKLCLSKDGSKYIEEPVEKRDLICDENKVNRIPKDRYGTLEISSEKVLKVTWDHEDGLTEKKQPKTAGIAKTADLSILPGGWKRPKNWKSHVTDLVSGVNKISDAAKQLFQSFFASKQQNLAELMSGSVSKWVVCPVRGDASDEELDAQLGVEDEAFKDFQMEAYKKWTGFEAAIPGDKCDLDPKDLLADGGEGFSALKGCEINELHADHVERYTTGEGENIVAEKFICPLRPALVPVEQLEVLKEKKDTCFLHMTSKQRRQYVWHYQGEFPARRQNDRKSNVPRAEFELVKLLKVPSEGITSEVNYGRYCSLEEANAQPRFCDLPKIHNEWKTLNAYAESLSAGLTAIAGGVNPTDPKTLESVAPLLVGASAVANSLSEYKEKLQKKEVFTKENAKKAALWVGENTYDGLRGTGRLLKSTVTFAVKKFKGTLKGAGRVSTDLENRLFSTEKSGEMLHGLSFQKSIGESKTTSNSKERFQRYVMTYPCKDFDPARDFALKKKWSLIALRMVREAHRASQWRASGAQPLDMPSLQLELQGLAARYRLSHKEAEDSVSHKPFASMRWVNAPAVDQHLKCKSQDPCDSFLCHDNGAAFSLNPFAERCEDAHWKESVEAGKFWPVLNDVDLEGAVAPTITAGTFDLDGTNLFGLKMELFCAPKKDFGPEGSPEVKEGHTLKKCLEEGVLTNAKLHSKEPWKLYFPDEVIVMARFSDITEQQFFSTKDAKEEDTKALSALDAAQDQDFFKFLLDKDGKPYLKKPTDKDEKFVGMRAGKGYPQGTLEEVFFGPHDVLEALELMQESYGR
mmetsp:Transcript_79992/g.166333  ORF Transcript_79992/g.166333 Transcript_79992/m.166333 type:complete len:1400 (-) Transcript_79992:60-4259(-)